MSNRLKRNLVIFTPVFLLAIFWFFALTTKSLAVESATSALSNTGSGIGHTVLLVWQSVMGVVDSAIILALIYVAFMNILRIQMDSYTIKKILPTLIMAVILANFSFLIARVLLDVSNIIVYFLINDAGVRGSNTAGAFGVLTEKIPDPSTLASGSAVSIYFEYMMKQGVAIVGAVFIWILGFLFLIRNYMIYFMVAIAPAAFMAMVLPVTKKFFTMWWSNYAKWVFAPVVAVFWIWLGAAFYGTVASSTSSGTGWFIQMGFVIACYYMAFTSPFKLGKVMTTWGGLGNKALKTAGSIHDWSSGKIAQKAAEKADALGSGHRMYKGLKAASNIATLSNPRMMKQAWKERTGYDAKLRDKAMLKATPYGKIAGPYSQIEMLSDKAYNDHEFDDGATLAGLSRGKLDTLLANPNAITHAGFRGEIEEIIARHPGDEGAQRQALALKIATKNPVDLYQQLRGNAGLNTNKDIGDFAGILKRTLKSSKLTTSRGSLTPNLDNNGTPLPGQDTLFSSTGGQGGFDDDEHPVVQVNNILKQNGITGRNANLAMSAATGAPIEVSAIIRGFTPEGRTQFMNSYSMAGKTVAKYEDALSSRTNGRLQAARNIVGDPNQKIGDAEIKKANKTKEDSEVAIKLLHSNKVAEAAQMAVQINPSVEPALKLSGSNSEAMKAQLEKVLKDTNSAAQDVINHQGSTVHELTTNLNMNIKSHASAQFHMDGLLNGETSLQDATSRAVLSNKDVQKFVESHSEQAPQMIAEIEKKVNERLGQTMQKVAGSKSLTSDRKAVLADAMAAESTKIVSQTLASKS